MISYRSKGDAVDLTVPAGSVTKDVPVQIGQLIVIPQVSITYSASLAQKFSGITRGVIYGMVKKSGESWVEGDPLYADFETTPVSLTKTAGDNHQFGHSLEVVGSSVTTSGEVLFQGNLAMADETT